MAPMTLTVAIPSELEKFVESKVTSGAYADAGELVGAALRHLQSLDDGDAWPLGVDEKEQVRRRIDEGWESARAGRLLAPAQLEADMAAFKLKWKQERGVA